MWKGLGYAHQHLGHHKPAINCHERARELFVELGDRYQEAEVLADLGDTHEAAGNHDGAREYWRQALIILTDLAHPYADEVRTKLKRHDEVTAQRPSR